MKKQFLLLTAASLFSFSTLLAQDNDRQRPNAGNRTTVTMEKLAPLSLDAANKAKTEVVFNDFYATQRKTMQELRASGNLNRETMKEKQEQLIKDRDEKLKAIFTADQMKKWKDEIEPSMRAARPVPPPPAAPGTPPPPPTDVPGTPPPVPPAPVAPNNN